MTDVLLFFILIALLFISDKIEKLNKKMKKLCDEFCLEEEIKKKK